MKQHSRQPHANARRCGCPGHDGRTGRGPVRHEHGTLTTLSDDRKPTNNVAFATKSTWRAASVTLPAVGEPGRGLRAWLVAASVVALAALLLPSAIGAGSPSRLQERAQELRNENSSLENQARATWLSSVTLSTRLGPDAKRARALQSEAGGDLRRAGRGRAEPAPRAPHVEVSQNRLAGRLRLLYEQGADDPMSVLVGATSVDDAINRIDSLHRIAGLDREVIDAAKSARAHLTVITQRLATDEAQARADRSCDRGHGRRARGGPARAGGRPSPRCSAKRSSNSSQISTLESQARELAATPGASQSGRTLTVLATGYSLAGHTSTGVPGRLRDRRRRPEPRSRLGRR